jgi:carbonic anhydrase
MAIKLKRSIIGLASRIQGINRSEIQVVECGYKEESAGPESRLNIHYELVARGKKVGEINITEVYDNCRKAMAWVNNYKIRRRDRVI